MTSSITPLRQRMLDDMQLRNLAPLTRAAYIRAVKNLSLYHHRSPDQLSYEEVRAYLLHLTARGLSAQAVNQIACAIRFFYSVTLGKTDASTHIPLARRPDTLPAVLTQDEVLRFLEAVEGVKYKAAFATIYAAGLRVSEAATLTVQDIDSQRMVIHVRQGKGRKDRIVMLSAQLLAMLRDYWKQERPRHWLFPGSDPNQPVTPRSLQRAFRIAAAHAGLSSSVSVHTLRHCFATHLLEQGVELRVIQELLGHRHITSTTRYARVATNAIRKIQSPFEALNLAFAPPA